jgi:hypothetical protein
MKIRLDIECTPEEARAFMGFPDFRPLHEEFLGSLRERMGKVMGGMDAESMFKQWIQGGAQAVDQFQKAFWEQFGKK